MSLLTAVHGRGLLSARPAAAAANEGYVYSASDADLYRSNGSTWDTIASAAVTDATIATTDVTTNNASTSKHGWLKKLSNVSTEYMSGTGVFSTPAGGVAHTIVSNALSGDVSLSTANTYFTGPSVTLSAGTWLLLGGVTCDGVGGNATSMTAKLWDGTTVIASGQQMCYGGGSWDECQIALSGTVVIASGTPTWKISVAANASTATFIKAATQDNAAGNTASFLTAILIA